MKNAKKIIALLLCAVLLVGASIAGTVAYLTAEDGVTNTFTVGKVQITLDETDVDEYGVAIEGEDRVKENTYKLIPGHTYVKDPTVHILEDSETAYVRMLVKVTNYSNLKDAMPAEKYPTFYDANGGFLLQNLVDGWDPAVWETTNVISADGDVATYEFRYFEPVAGPADDNDASTTLELALAPLFTEITVPGTVNNAELQNLKNVTINVEAHAIQKDGFDNAAAAWAAFAA